ncbi:MAG: methanethiol S-methyltransferase [Pirellulaceae bacterium]
MKRYLILAWGVFNYAVFLGVFLYAIAFVGNFWVPVSLDSAPRSPLWAAIAINLGLLGLFAVQHSLMARPFFKDWITRYIPQPAERPTYVGASNLAMIVLFIFWQPMGPMIWSVTNPVAVLIIYAIYFVGWGILLAATFMINHFDLFGLRQVWLEYRGQPYTRLKFTKPGFYKYVRHPLYVGWLTIFWAAPVMSAGHLLFALGTTAYILIAIQLEERDLEAALGVDYRQYKNEVPMLIPGLGTSSRPPADSGVHQGT